jgi:hypothetical protein
MPCRFLQDLDPGGNRFSDKILVQDRDSEIRMSSGTAAVFLTVALTSSIAGPDKPALPNAIVTAALKQAQCGIPANEARVVGTEQLSHRLELVEMTCWRGAYNAGSILFAVPDGRPQDARLLMVERWQNGRVQPSYSISSPGYDRATRTLSSNHKARGAGDCGTIEEWQWTGWHFQLLNVWNKERCDGEPFEWESRDKWQVFPKRAGRQDINTPD